MISWRRLASTVLAFSVTATSSLALQARPQSAGDGVYTDLQATRGQTLYAGRCTSCHGNILAGRVGPPLAGDDFLAKWSAQPLLDLASKIRRTMPKDDTARLSPQETADLLAYMLQAAKFPSGRGELSSNDDALKLVTFPARQAAPVGSLSISAFPPAGTVAEVMRGILFPSSNIIFTTQPIDPGAKKAVADSGTGGFDWLTWGGGVYRGWDVVDYASVSVAESATLMLTPGRRCENGRLAPVTEPDWIKFTKELFEAGKASYKASQTRNQETVADSTNQLNDSCMNCHRVYRGRTHCVKN